MRGRTQIFMIVMIYYDFENWNLLFYQKTQIKNLDQSSQS